MKKKMQNVKKWRSIKKKNCKIMHKIITEIVLKKKKRKELLGKYNKMFRKLKEFLGKDLTVSQFTIINT